MTIKKSATFFVDMEPLAGVWSINVWSLCACPNSFDRSVRRTIPTDRILCSISECRGTALRVFWRNWRISNDHMDVRPQGFCNLTKIRIFSTSLSGGTIWQTRWSLSLPSLSSAPNWSLSAWRGPWLLSSFTCRISDEFLIRTSPTNLLRTNIPSSSSGLLVLTVILD